MQAFNVKKSAEDSEAVKRWMAKQADEENAFVSYHMGGTIHEIMGNFGPHSSGSPSLEAVGRPQNDNLASVMPQGLQETPVASMGAQGGPQGQPYFASVVNPGVPLQSQSTDGSLVSMPMVAGEMLGQSVGTFAEMVPAVQPQQPYFASVDPGVPLQPQDTSSFASVNPGVPLQPQDSTASFASMMPGVPLQPQDSTASFASMMPGGAQGQPDASFTSQQQLMMAGPQVAQPQASSFASMMPGGAQGQPDANFVPQQQMLMAGPQMSSQVTPMMSEQQGGSFAGVVPGGSQGQPINIFNAVVAAPAQPGATSASLAPGRPQGQADAPDMSLPWGPHF